MILETMTTPPVKVDANLNNDSASTGQVVPTQATSSLLGKHIFFIGIGGSGMSGLAQMYAERGAIVSGSDKEASDVTRAMAAKRINVTFDQGSGWLPDSCERVVASAAIPADHPQVLAAHKRNIEVQYYAQALGGLMKTTTAIAIAGTHGKSTTTAMLGVALTDAGIDPSVIVGATVPQLAGGALQGSCNTHAKGYRVGNVTIPQGGLLGRPGVLVAEACEYNRSFHNYHATLAVINNIEADHLDVYGTLDNVVESFREFALKLPPASKGGALLIHHDHAFRDRVTTGLECKVETFGFSPQADWNISYEPSTRRVNIIYRGTPMATWCNSLSGEHNALNAAVAYVLGIWAGAESNKLSESLALFRGADRRMQHIGDRPATSGDVTNGKVRIFDDYAHHPTEVLVTLSAFRESVVPKGAGGRLIVVFQPHQHSRTRHLLAEFAASFSAADIVLVPHIYFVRDTEDERTKVTASDLVDRLRDSGVEAYHLYPFEAIITHLRAVARAGDVVVTMGAGDVWRIGRDYLNLPAS